MMISLPKILIPYKSIDYSKLKEEQKMCVEFANSMRQRTLSGGFPYIWFHISNEFLPSTRTNYSFDLKLKHMGKFSGLPDYCFISKTDSFFIEFKSKKGKQSDNQKIFQEWCDSSKIDYYICRNFKEGEFLIDGKIKALQTTK
jgi:hypothetical protein